MSDAGRHVSLSDRMMQVIPSDARTPEDLLLEAEEPEEAPRRDRSLHPARKLLKKLPPGDVEILRMALGEDATNAAIGKLRRVSKQAISKRLRAAQKRLAWLRGPGGLFTAIDVHRDLLWRMVPEDRRLLCAFWRLRNTRAVSRETGRHVSDVRARLRALVETDLVQLAAAEPERYGRYVKGFRALRIAITGGGSLFQGM